MTKKESGLWFEMNSPDETMKRLTILPDKMTDEMKAVIMTLYGSMIEELDSKQANEILVRSSPKDSKVRQMQMQQIISNSNASMKKMGGVEQAGNVKYCQYPPTGSNSVSVTMEDYYCLEDESFLNDVVIDFFFKWLQFSQLGESDRNRTHIFSTFFYKRLTTRPPKQKNKLHPIEDNVNMSSAEKRYERVKRWTKKVNIFEKDFVVVPINEHSHWFVAVICFPGLDSCVSIDKNEKVEVPESQVRAAAAQVQRKKRRRDGGGQVTTKRVLTIGSTSIIPLQHGKGGLALDKIHLDDDSSDRDEAEASDDDLLDEAEEFSLLKRNGITLKEQKKESPESQESEETEKKKDASAQAKDEKEDKSDEGEESESKSDEKEEAKESENKEELEKSEVQNEQEKESQKPKETPKPASPKDDTEAAKNAIKIKQ